MDAAKQFKDGLKKSYMDALSNASPGASSELMKDMTGFSKEMKEDKKEKKSKVTAKQQFASDLQADPDYQEFKRNAVYNVNGREFTHGAPNVTKDDLYIKKRTKYGRPGRGKEETKEATGSGSSGSFVGPVAFMDSDFVKKSFAETPGVGKKMKEGYGGRRPFHIKITKLEKATNDEGMEFQVGDFAKTLDTNETIKINGIIKKEGKTWAQFRDKYGAQEILIDGLIPHKKVGNTMNRMKIEEQTEESVEKIEATEATGSGSVGGYSSPSMWAKSTSKKDWGPSRKTQYKGGSFVKVKKKCTKFPYCNQGDINALKLTKNESVQEAIKSVSQKMNLSEKIIESILQNEYKKLIKRTK